MVDINYPYNTIFGRNTIIKFVAVIHQPYLCMKLPTTGGIVTVFRNEEEACRCEDNTTYTTKNVHAIEAAEAADSDDKQTTPEEP